MLSLHPAYSSDRTQPTRIPIKSRGEFLDEFQEGYVNEHVTLLGPTQRGKTYLSHQMLARVISPQHKCLLLSCKPPGRDKTMIAAAKNLNLRVVNEYPPGWHYKDRSTNGYVLMPHQSMSNIEADKKNMTNQHRAALVKAYGTDSKHPMITVADEAHKIQNTYKLKDEYEAPLMSGAPDNAMWSLIQRGYYMSYLAYDAPEHFIIFYDPDEANQKRYSEIGGVDPTLIRRTVAGLKTHKLQGGNTISEALYIKRSGPEISIIDVA